MAKQKMASSSRSSRQRPINTAQGVRSGAASAKRSIGASLRASSSGDDADACRVRVAVRLRPKNTKDLHPDADCADCVELQPQLRRLKLRKNNWTSESYKFDEVFTENASQKRVYEVVAKPIVESVLNGFNGTVMTYGQTGTGKTYTIGGLGESDKSERGIMVRAMEDILMGASSGSATVAISYLQLYLESIQDLLAPDKKNIAIVDDPRTHEVLLPGAVIITVRDLDHFLQLLRIGEANRHVANTKMNTESSRSHAVLMVCVQRSSEGKEENENSASNDVLCGEGIPVVSKSKLLIVDLAGSERIDKSGSDGHMLEEAKFINLSLTSLGKCINALAENSRHIPTRDSKLTRLLRDSFGGSARTSLIITIGPSVQYYAETASTIMFGQRAMRIVNVLKLKEEFDYESQWQKLQEQVDSLTVELEREQNLRNYEKKLMEEKLKICEDSLAELEISLTLRSEQYQLESSAHQKALADTTQMYEERIEGLTKQLEEMHTCYEISKDHLARVQKLLCDNEKPFQLQYQLECSTYQKVLADTTQMHEKIVDLSKQLGGIQTNYENSNHLTRRHTTCFNHMFCPAVARMVGVELSLDNIGKINAKLQEMDELRLKLQEISELNEKAVVDIQSLKAEKETLLLEKGLLYAELGTAQQKLMEEESQRRYLEAEINKVKKLYTNRSLDEEVQKSSDIDTLDEAMPALRTRMSLPESRKLKGTKKGDTITKIFKEVGLKRLIALLRSEDLDVQTLAVKVVANLAAEDLNQEHIVQEGGLDALLLLLESSHNAIVQRVASGAIANLAMNGMSQEQIICKGGARLLGNIAFKTNDSQTMRMVAGAIANLCGNEKVHSMLKEDGGTKALLAMARSGHSDVIAQVARGLANFAKCESRGIAKGWRKGKSLLIDDGALGWLIANSTTASGSTRRHIDLALCHLAQNGNNLPDIISSGGIKELIRLSHDSSREDVCNLAKKILDWNPTFLADLQEFRRAT